MGKKSVDETFELLRSLDEGGSFEGMQEQTNESFDGAIHSVVEVSSGDIYLSQGEVPTNEGIVVAIDKDGRFEELTPDQYDILEVLEWNEETDELDIVAYSEE